VHVQDLGTLAQACLLRLTLQLELRPPKPSLNQHKAMLLDPRVKATAVGEHYGDRKLAETELKLEHRELYAKLRQANVTTTVTYGSGADADVSIQTTDKESHEDAAPRPQCYFQDAPTSRYLVHLEADDIWKRWMSLKVAWEEHTGADILLSPSTYDIWKLYKEVDVLDWFNRVGVSSFPSIAILARAYLAMPMSNAFQERFFSTAGYVLNVKRTSLDSSRAEKMQILMHNSK